MALAVTITPGTTLSTTEKVTNAKLNAGFNPSAAMSGTLDPSTQTTLALTYYGTLAFGATSASAPVAVVPDVASKVFRMLGIKLFRINALTWASATKIIVECSNATQLAEAAKAAVDAAIELPDTALTWTAAKGGGTTDTGTGVQIRTDAATTSGSVVVAVTGCYE